MDQDIQRIVIGYCLGRRVIDVCNPRGSSGQRTLCCRPVWIGYRPLINADLHDRRHFLNIWTFEGAPGWCADWLDVRLFQHQPFFGEPGQQSNSSVKLIAHQWLYLCSPGKGWWQNIWVVPRYIIVAEIIRHNYHNVWSGCDRTNVEDCEVKPQKDKMWSHFKHHTYGG